MSIVTDSREILLRDASPNNFTPYPISESKLRLGENNAIAHQRNLIANDNSYIEEEKLSYRNLNRILNALSHTITEYNLS